MVSSRSVITESSGHRAFTKSLASQSSRVERFSHQRTFSAERHGKRSGTLRAGEIASSDHGALFFQVPALNTSCRFQSHSV